MRGIFAPAAHAGGAMAADMTDEEAEAWDEFITNNDIMPRMDLPGFFEEREKRAAPTSPRGFSAKTEGWAHETEEMFPASEA